MIKSDTLFGNITWDVSISLESVFAYPPEALTKSKQLSIKSNICVIMNFM